MGEKTATLLWMGICALFLLTVVTSKPVSLNDAGEESDSDSNSSEESVNEEVEEQELEEPEQPEQAEPEPEPEPSVTEAPVALDLSPPPATIALPDPTALPSDAFDPQTSTDPQTDGLQLIPDPDPAQTSLGVDVAQDMPETDPAHDALNPDQLAPHADVGVEVGITTLAQQTNEVAVQQELLPAATPYPPYAKGKAAHVSVVSAVPLHVGPGVPVCFTFQYAQYASPEFNPPRGDSY